MTGLPASIEAYLDESGFSATEILVLKRLLEGHAMTLRELAARTGKSTGVLDQATKKLLGKGILTKEQINDGLKYTLGSLEAITTWVQKDMQEKKDNLHRKQQNFETYIASLKLDRSRPDMEYFDGEEGIKKAYMRLLDCGKEMLQYLPVQYKEEEDPLRDFKVEYFRERRKRKIFLRVIAHETALGKRFQSRDMFEYRKTILVPEDRCPLPFEQIICGDTVACFNHTEQKVCFIKFKEYSESERKFFEAVWQHPQQLPIPISYSQDELDEAQEISLRTKTFSGLREFFLSRKSIATFIVLGVLSAGITYGLYLRTSSLNLQRIKEQVQSVAATAALQFDSADLIELQIESDWQKPQWVEVVNQLAEIRENNNQIVYAYILRKNILDNSRVDFVADSHSINPYANMDDDPNNDVNVDDGIGSSLLAWPGQKYEDFPEEILEGFTKPTTSKDFYSDAWGTFISGYAPIKNNTGDTAAILAIDISASKLEEFNNQSFAPVWSFIIFFIFFVFVRFSAFNRSLLKDVITVSKSKKVLASLAVCGLVSLLATYGLYLYTLKLTKEELKARLIAIAATSALQIDSKEIELLKFARDMKRPEYQRVFQKLNDIRSNNPGVKWAYVFRKSEFQDFFEFVADADSNYYLPFYSDYNNDGILTESEENLAPGITYADVTPTVLKALSISTSEEDFYISQWGVVLTGYAPIKNANNETVAILGIDMDVSDLYQIMKNRFIKWIWFLVIFLLLTLLRIIQLYVSQNSLKNKK